MHILGAIAEFERGRIVERVRAGLARAKASGKRLGRQPYAIADAQFAASRTSRCGTPLHSSGSRGRWFTGIWDTCTEK